MDILNAIVHELPAISIKMADFVSLILVAMDLLVPGPSQLKPITFSQLEKK